ncbi:multidrug transporter [Halobacteriales archaeon QS_5_70_17]|nr:MAG: multidrug transporter [Halobacteriales archaeon QS_5_70_17]
MSYLLWALLALAAYTLVPLFTKVATGGIPSNTVALWSNGVFVVITLAVVVVADNPVLSALDDPKAPYMFASGVCLAVGILAYYRALALGPVNVVVPIFGMFIVTSALVGAVLLDEPLTLRKGAGVVLAVVAVVLVTVE